MEHWSDDMYRVGGLTTSVTLNPFYRKGTELIR